MVGSPFVQENSNTRWRTWHFVIVVAFTGFLFITGCAGTVPPIPEDFAYLGEKEAIEQTKSLCETVQNVVDGGWNLGRGKAILERIEDFQLSSYTQEEWIDWFSFQNNILIEIPGSAKEIDKKIVYIVAHYDKTDVTPFKFVSLLLNGLLDELFSWMILSDGAIDNATGVAVSLELAKAIKKAKLKRTYRILLVGSEESGLRGSRAHVAGISEGDWEKISLMINIDSVATNFSPNAVISNVSHPYFVKKVIKAARKLQMTLKEARIPSGASGDFAPFSSTSFPLDFGRGLSMNLVGGLLPQRSWFTSFHGVPVISFAAEELIGIADVLSGFILLPIGQIHGPRDSAEKVDPTRLYEQYAILVEFIRLLEEDDPEISSIYPSFEEIKKNILNQPKNSPPPKETPHSPTKNESTTNKK